MPCKWSPKGQRSMPVHRGKNQVRVYTHWLRSMGIAGSIQDAHWAGGLASWCTQTYLGQVRTLKTPRSGLGWNGGSSSSSRSSNGGSRSPGRRERYFMSSMLGPVVRNQLFHPSLEPVPIASAQILNLRHEHQDRNCLCSVSRHFSKLLQNESVILWFIARNTYWRYIYI